MIYGAILEKGLKGFTYFKEIFCSLDNFQKDYNWLITDVEAAPFKESHYERITQSGTYAWISGEELTGIIKKDNFQWIWGVLSGFEKCYAKEEILKYDLPYADGQGGFWKTELSVQHPLASVELVAWDGALTLFLSKQENLVKMFRTAFPLSDDLKEYNRGIIEEKKYLKWLQERKS